MYERAQSIHSHFLTRLIVYFPRLTQRSNLRLDIREVMFAAFAGKIIHGGDRGLRHSLYNSFPEHSGSRL